MPRRNRALLVTALLLLSLGRSQGEDYAARLKELQSQKAPGAQIDSLLDEWRAKQPNDPEPWIASANYYFNQSVGPMISTKKPEKGDYGLTNKETGKEAGSISFKPGVAQTSRQASDLLQEAAGKFPDRLDIWCGLTWMYQERGDFDNELATLKKMVAYAREHPTGLKWLKDEPITDPADKFVPEKLHSYGVYYEKKDTPEDDQRFLKIAMFATEQYPNHPFAYNDVALYYSNTGDRKKAREWLEKAHQVDPKDGLIMFNLGRISAEAGDKAAARKWYEESIKADPEGEHVEAAKEALKKLKK
jgi:tetratricopeptide (TPR) repeat protein